MEANDVLNQIYDHLVTHSGLEARRGYLGMSTIAKCPRALFNEYMFPRRANEQSHLYCYGGYLFERDMKMRLGEMGIYKPGSEMELTAPFDARFRGHTDGATTDGMLLEIKSSNAKGFEMVRQQHRCKPEHYLQVQTYLRYGPFSDALVVYVCRESLQHEVLRIARSEMSGQEMEDKAKFVLEAIDARRAPKCVCGFCRR